MRREIVYLHLANIRKMIGAHSSIEMLHIIRSTAAFNPRNLKLTPRGKEVFRFILEGIRDKQIGKRLNISYSGVRRHKEKMLLTNGCGTVPELVTRYHEAYAQQSHMQRLVFLLRNLLIMKQAGEP